MVVKNEVPFAVPLAISTATVTITVQDVNEPPVFEPVEKQIMIHEDLDVGSTISKYTANDPDTAREQKIRFYMDTHEERKNTIILTYHKNPFLCITQQGIYH